MGWNVFRESSVSCFLRYADNQNAPARTRAQITTLEPHAAAVESQRPAVVTGHLSATGWCRKTKA